MLSTCCRTFSNGKPVESVETEKSRVVLKELEQGWWILAVGLAAVRCGTTLIVVVTVH